MNAIRGEPLDWLGSAKRQAATPIREWVAALDGLDTPTARARIRARYRIKRDEWARYCLPRSVLKRGWNAYHRHVFSRPAIHHLDREAARLKIRDADAAPRGIAKSTLAKIELMHRLCYGLEGFVVVLSATQRDARLWRNTIEQWCGGKQRSKKPRRAGSWPPPRMVELHGAITCRPGPDESLIVQVGDRNPVTILSLSFGTAIRGINDAVQRPTLVIIDDGEDRKKVKNQEIRDEWQAFLNEDVLKLGDLGGGLEVWWRGTVLDRDSILQRLLDGRAPNAGWRGTKWKALTEWPTREDLWTECGRIFLDLRTSADPAIREMAARAFYAHNKAEMDRGAVVLDEQALPVFECYRSIWTEGKAGFLKELQNEPSDPATQVYASDAFARCRVTHDKRRGWLIQPLDALKQPIGDAIRLADCRTLLRWDPSMGGVSGDFAALALLARDPSGYTYVVAGWMQRVKPTAQLEAALAMCEAYGLNQVSLETNGFQALIGDDFERVKAERKAAGLFWQVTINREPSTTDKNADIGAMEVPITARWLVFADDISQPMMLQWDAWAPKGSSGHDDFPDAIARGYKRMGGVMPGFSASRIQ